jgi:hypothetical protein
MFQLPYCLMFFFVDEAQGDSGEGRRKADQLEEEQALEERLPH